MNDTQETGTRDFVAELRRTLGEESVLTEPGQMAPYLVDWRAVHRGDALAVVRPDRAELVADAVRLAVGAGVAVVPQGGNTGLVGGAAPLPDRLQIVISLSRLKRIREIDAENFTMTVEAGCVLADAQAAAAEQGRLLPLSFAAEGSAQIGGALSTNAGGTTVLRYGNARSMVLGLEVVLPDGTLWHGLRRLRKDNTGYDLKQLFIGAEGTLGVITAATLQLYPLPLERVVALAAVPGPEAALRFLARVREASGDRVTSFELIQWSALAIALDQVEGLKDPMNEPHPWYVLTELTSSARDSHLDEVLERALAEAFEAEEVQDAVIAQSEEQAAGLWRLREELPEAQARAGPNLKHDVSVPVSAVPKFLTAADERVRAVAPDAVIAAFGHLGDGNIHYNLVGPAGEEETYRRRASEIAQAIYDEVVRFEGSISAEHGLGQLKREAARRVKSPVELQLMRRIKQSLDPEGLMNPGKVL